MCIKGADNMGRLGTGMGLGGVLVGLGLLGGFCAIVGTQNALTPLAIGLVSSTALPLIGALGGLYLVIRSRDLEEDDFFARRKANVDSQL